MTSSLVSSRPVWKLHAFAQADGHLFGVGCELQAFGEHGHGVELVVEDADDVPHAAEVVECR